VTINEPSWVDGGFWTVAEAITWIMTRDQQQVSAISDPFAPLVTNDEVTRALEALCIACCDARVRSVGQQYQ
jgi:hypothetical protein